MDFDEYVAARGQALLRFGYFLSGDAHLAEDLVQTALVKAYSHWRRVTAADQPEAYLRRMIVNSFLDHRRRRSAHEVPVDLGPPFGPCPSSDDHAEWIVCRSEMRLALARLPKKQRAVLVLRYYEDLSDSTIAMLLGCAQSTVRSNAARALITEVRRDTVDGLYRRVSCSHRTYSSTSCRCAVRGSRPRAVHHRRKTRRSESVCSRD